jgi:hypothetical protein
MTPDGPAESRYHPANNKRPARGRLRETVLEDDMQILVVSLCMLAAIWVVVLWGSRYLGPQ